MITLTGDNRPRDRRGSVCRKRGAGSSEPEVLTHLTNKSDIRQHEKSGKAYNTETTIRGRDMLSFACIRTL